MHPFTDMGDDVQDVEASSYRLMLQAPATVGFYLDEAIKRIDATLGDGTAKKQPALVAAFMQACAADFLAARIAIAGQEVRKGLLSISETIPQDNG